MSRSSKKGPFIEERLLRRIEQMNESGTKQMVVHEGTLLQTACHT